MAYHKESNAPQSAPDSDPPSHRCGFELLPADVGQEYTLEDWRDNAETASCCREVEKSGQCQWHADVAPELMREAIVTRDERARNLDGVSIHDVELDDPISFEGCRLRGAIFNAVTAQEANFADVNLSWAEFLDGDLSGAEFSNANLDQIKVLDTCLKRANLSDVHLLSSDFTNAELGETDFSDAYIRGGSFSNARLNQANFSGANLSGSEFPGAKLVEAKFSAADLRFTDFSRARLRKAEFLNARLGGAEFVNTDLRETDITGIQVNRATFVDELTEPSTPSLQIVTDSLNPFTENTGEEHVDWPGSAKFLPDTNRWDITAQMYHNLKLEFNKNGFVGRARRFHMKERRARRHETAEEEGWFSIEHLTALISGLFTGYGVGVRRLLVTMLVLFTLSTLTYAAVGINNPLTYSAITFTTSPPRPTGSLPLWARFVADVETFAGTLLIVSLGFVLGNREQF